MQKCPKYPEQFCDIRKKKKNKNIVAINVKIGTRLLVLQSGCHRIFQKNAKPWSKVFKCRRACDGRAIEKKDEGVTPWKEYSCTLHRCLRNPVGVTFRFPLTNPRFFLTFYPSTTSRRREPQRAVRVKTFHGNVRAMLLKIRLLSPPYVSLTPYHFNSKMHFQNYWTILSLTFPSNCMQS